MGGSSTPPQLRHISKSGEYHRSRSLLPLQEPVQSIAVGTELIYLPKVVPLGWFVTQLSRGGRDSCRTCGHAVGIGPAMRQCRNG